MFVSDLRKGSETARRCVTTAEGQRVAKEHNVAYAETSALTQEGVKDCFNSAVSVCL